MLNETMLSFEQWENMLISEGAEIPTDIVEKNKLYEKYIVNYNRGTPEN